MGLIERLEKHYQELPDYQQTWQAAVLIAEAVDLLVEIRGEMIRRHELFSNVDEYERLGLNENQADERADENRRWLVWIDSKLEKE